jgi:site-specific recombinase XerD
MNESIRTAAISPLRLRLIDDINMRRFSRETQRSYIRDVGRFATFLGRSPDTATADDLRGFQIDQHDAGMPTPTMHSIVSALRFFFTHTGDRPELARKLIRVERGKGGRYRNAMLPANLLTLLREWWKLGRQQGVMARDGWLFPGQHAMKPISTRQLHRIVVEAAQAAEITKRIGPHTLRHSCAPSAAFHVLRTRNLCCSAHLFEDGVDIRVIQVLLGHAKLDNTAFYTNVATRTVRTATSPLDKLGMFKTGEIAPTG